MVWLAHTCNVLHFLISLVPRPSPPSVFDKRPKTGGGNGLGTRLLGNYMLTCRAHLACMLDRSQLINHFVRAVLNIEELASQTVEQGYIRSYP